MSFAPGKHPNQRHPAAECLQPGVIKPRLGSHKPLHHRRRSGEPSGSGVSEPMNHLLTAGEDASPNSGWQAGLKQTPPAEAHCSYCCYKVNERKQPQAKPATSACCLCVCACLPGGVRKTFNDFMIQAATQRENAVKSGGCGLLTSLGGAEGGAKRLKSWMYYKN